MITPPITKADIDKESRFLRNDGTIVRLLKHELDEGKDGFCCSFGWWYYSSGKLAGFPKNDHRTLIKRVGSPVAEPHQIRTTHPSDDSGVALLSRHFETQDTIDQPEAMRKYGIGRLSARVFDLNKWYTEQGMKRRIVCIKKQVIKANGRKAYVTDYYRLEVTL